MVVIGIGDLGRAIWMGWRGSQDLVKSKWLENTVCRRGAWVSDDQ